MKTRVCYYRAYMDSNGKYRQCLFMCMHIYILTIKTRLMFVYVYIYTGFRLRGGQKRGKRAKKFLTLGGQISMYTNSYQISYWI